MNGELDFYSNFRHVDSTHGEDEFEEIAADFKQFYLAKKKTESKEFTDIMKCALHWKNRIGETTMLEWPHKELHEARWPTITHRRVAQYVRLY